MDALVDAMMPDGKDIAAEARHVVIQSLNISGLSHQYVITQEDLNACIAELATWGRSLYADGVETGRLTLRLRLLEIWSRRGERERDHAWWKEMTDALVVPGTEEADTRHLATRLRGEKP